MDTPHDMDDVLMLNTKDSTFSIISKRLRSDDKLFDVHIKLNRVLGPYSTITDLAVSSSLGTSFKNLGGTSNIFRDQGRIY